MWYVKCWQTDRFVKFFEGGAFVRTYDRSKASEFKTRIQAEYALQGISLPTGFVTPIT